MSGYLVVVFGVVTIFRILADFPNIFLLWTNPKLAVEKHREITQESIDMLKKEDIGELNEEGIPVDTIANVRRMTVIITTVLGLIYLILAREIVAKQLVGTLGVIYLATSFIELIDILYSNLKVYKEAYIMFPEMDYSYRDMVLDLNKIIFLLTNTGVIISQVIAVQF